MKSHCFLFTDKDWSSHAAKKTPIYTLFDILEIFFLVKLLWLDSLHCNHVYFAALFSYNLLIAILYQIIYFDLSW